jgi:hypothetical protein
VWIDRGAALVCVAMLGCAEPGARVGADEMAGSGSDDGSSSAEGDGDSDPSNGDGDGDGDGDSGDGDGDGDPDPDPDPGDGDGDEPPSCVPAAFVHAPSPALVADFGAVPLDILDLDATIDFDLAAGSAHAEVTLRFQLGEDGGPPFFDLRQSHASLVLDGEPIANELLARHDFGRGWAAGFSILDVEFEPCTIHELELTYELELPQAPGSGGLDFAQDPPRLWLDLYASDLEPGRYLESWLPANMPWDRHPVHLGVSLSGAGVEHRLLTNAEVEELDAHLWQLEFPGSTTALAPMLVIQPAEELSFVAGIHAAANGQDIPYQVWVDAGLAAPAASFAAELVLHLDSFVLSTGDYPHPRFVAYLHQTTRSMEYAGATTSSPTAFEHEVFHSWWARGLEPATYTDGWIDEAWDMFNTWDQAFVAIPFDWQAPPVQLWDPHPFARDTADAAYYEGRLLFAGLADVMGLEPLRAAMAELYAFEGAPRSITTAQLERHLYCQSGELAEVRRAFHRFVYGLDGEPEAVAPGYCG